jgi:cytochrome b pre-mRNA-processing protein 3
VIGKLRWFGGNESHDRAKQLYVRVVEQARLPAFYRDLGVPDTVDGRFEMIVLHMMMMLRALRRDGDDGTELGQLMFDVMMDDMDSSLREMGAGDLGVGRRVKAMAQAFYGRATAYEEALAADDEALNQALRRNLYATAEPVEDDVAAMIVYVHRETSAIDAGTAMSATADEFRFGAPPDRNED